MPYLIRYAAPPSPERRRIAIIALGTEHQKFRLSQAAHRAAVKCYDDQYFPFWKDFGFDSSPGDYQERRNWTLSAKNIPPDLPLYLDSDGAMRTIAAIVCQCGYMDVCPTIECCR